MSTDLIEQTVCHWLINTYTVGDLGVLVIGDQRNQKVPRFLLVKKKRHQQQLLLVSFQILLWTIITLFINERYEIYIQ